MRSLERPLFTDENVSPEVVSALRLQGKDVRSAVEEGLAGKSDEEILRRAHAENRVVLTHDGDFGKLAVAGGHAYTGIVFLRPGHIAHAFVLEMLAAIEASPAEPEPPFVLVAERKGQGVRIRLRGASEP